jgi:hypothetical protein
MTASECLARITGGDTIQSHRIPFRMLVLRAVGLNRDSWTAPDVENKIEYMKDWSASEEAFSNSIDSIWLSRFGGQKAEIT